VEPGTAQGEQFRVVAGWERSDEPDPGVFQFLVVRGAVLPGVVDHGHRFHRLDELPVPGDQLVDDVAELGDVGSVSRVGVGHQRHPAVPGDHQRQPDQAQVRAFLLRLAALGDRRLAVGGVDERREVGHVQHQR
jgi:hypothetical protein